MDENSFRMDDYIQIHPRSQPTILHDSQSQNIVQALVHFTWTRAMVLALIEMYRVRQPLIPKKYRTIKAMYESIADDLNAEFKLALTCTQVTNKMKNLERAYKDVTDNNNATGRKRKDFEFESEMSSFMSKKRNVNPVLLLSDKGVEHEVQTPPPQDRRMIVIPVPPDTGLQYGLEAVDEDNIEEDFFIDQRMRDNIPLEILGSSGNGNNSTPRRIRNKKQTRVEVLEAMRKDRLMQVEKKLAVDARIAAAVEKKNELEQKKLELLSKLIDTMTPRTTLPESSD